jgi:DNA adenine methylase
MALLAELGFLPLNTRDDFNVLYKFLSARDEITDDYLQEEMELTEILLKPPEAEAIRALLLERAPRGDVRRAADYFKLVRYSFSGSSKSFGGKPCDIRRFFHLIWECSRRWRMSLWKTRTLRMSSASMTGGCMDLLRPARTLRPSAMR